MTDSDNKEMKLTQREKILLKFVLPKLLPKKVQVQVKKPSKLTLDLIAKLI